MSDERRGQSFAFCRRTPCPGQFFECPFLSQTFKTIKNVFYSQNEVIVQVPTFSDFGQDAFFTQQDQLMMRQSVFLDTWGVATNTWKSAGENQCPKAKWKHGENNCYFPINFPSGPCKIEACLHKVWLAAQIWRPESLGSYQTRSFPQNIQLLMSAPKTKKYSAKTTPQNFWLSPTFEECSNRLGKVVIVFHPFGKSQNLCLEICLKGFSAHTGVDLAS